MTVQLSSTRTRRNVVRVAGTEDSSSAVPLVLGGLILAAGIAMHSAGPSNQRDWNERYGGKK